LKLAPLVVGVSACLLWACSGAQTPTLIPATETPFPTRIPVTFPPTWTPTDTATPLPPSPTNTPTPTLEPTATLGPEQIETICDNFQFIYEFDPGEMFEPGEKIAFVVETQRWEVVVRFLAVHRLTGENQGVQMPGGQFVLVEMPVTLLPHPGLYDWTVSVHHDELGDFCTQGGYFFVSDAPPPEATAEIEETKEPED
jgi:hypothetical protein